MATVRALGADEIYKLSELGKQFYAEGKIPGKFVPSKFVETWSKLYQMNIGIVFGLLENGKIVGALGANIYPNPNDGELVASEMFWFVGEKHRGQGLKLLDEFERWASNRGAKRISMVHLVELAPAVLRKLYLRRGYRETEVHFLKSI